MRFSDMTHDELLNQLRLRHCQLADANTARAWAVQERDRAHERAANMDVELAAMTLSRDQARQEAERLRRQVEVLAEKYAEMVLCRLCRICTVPQAGTTCADRIIAWAAEQAKEGVNER